MYIKLNSEEKAMLVGYSSKPIYNNIGEMDNAQLLKIFDERKLEDDGDAWKLTLSSKSAELSQFSTIELYLRKSDFQPIKQEYFSHREKLVKTVFYRDYRDFEGVLRPALLEVQSASFSERKTILELISYRKDVKNRTNIFQKSNLGR